MAKNYRLKGHGSFAIREGWITKALLAIQEYEKQNPDKNFFSKENFNGADSLGVGSNMALSIKFWLRVSGLIEQKNTHLTELAHIILQYDPYLENDMTLYFLHINIASNRQEATIWNLFFQTMSNLEFDRQKLEERMKETFASVFQTDYPIHSLENDCSVLLQMYVRQNTEDIDPEDNRQCPFQRLHLISRHGKNYIRETQFDISGYAVLYAMKKQLQLKEPLRGHKVQSISIDELLQGCNSPGRLLNLTRISLNDALDELQNKGYLHVDRTAGLDMVYIAKDLPDKAEQIVKMYYEIGE